MLKYNAISIMELLNVYFWKLFLSRYYFIDLIKLISLKTI